MPISTTYSGENASSDVVDPSQVEALVREFSPGTLVSVVWLGPPSADFRCDEGEWVWSAEELRVKDHAIVLEARPEQAFVGGSKGQEQRVVIPFLCLCRGGLYVSTTWLARPVAP